jgi:hypothetical protein
LAFHHATGRLGTAIQKLVHNSAATPSSNQDDKSNDALAGAAGTMWSKRPHTDDADNAEIDMATTYSTADPSRHSRCSLQVVCLLPTLESRNVSTDLNLRSRALWCLVRCTVTSLWRSRLASSSTTASTTTTMGTTTDSLSTALTLVFCDGTILRLRQDEIVKALAEQHQAAPCEYQILAAIEKQLKEQHQQERQTARDDFRKAEITTAAFWNEFASKILATIQSDPIDDDGKSIGMFHVLDLTASRASATTTNPNNKRGDHDIEEIACLDLTKHIYSTNAARCKTTLKNGSKDVEFATLAVISIEDNGKFNSTLASTTTDTSRQQQHEQINMMAMRMRNGFVQACRSSCYANKIRLYSSRTFLTSSIPTCTTSSTISSSSSLPSASAASPYNDCHCACQDRQAAMITLLQHFLYQNRRLVPHCGQEASPATSTCITNSEKDNDSMNNVHKKRIILTTTTPAASDDDESSLPNKSKKQRKHKRKKDKHK